MNRHMYDMIHYELIHIKYSTQLEQHNLFFQPDELVLGGVLVARKIQNY